MSFLDSTEKQIQLLNIKTEYLKFLKQEYDSIGFCSTYTDDNYLFECSIEVLKRYNDQLKLINKLQEQCCDIGKDNESYSKKVAQLQETVERKQKEIDAFDNKFRKIESKLNAANKLMKDEQDEKKKVKQQLEQREIYFKHERKKIESQIEKLREKMNSITTTKSVAFSNLDLNENLKSLKRSTNLSNDGEHGVYVKIIQDYERKTKDLMMENVEVKECLAKFVAALNSMLLKLNIAKENELIDSEDVENLPFENLSMRLNKYLKNYFNDLESNLNRSLENMSNTFTVNSDDENDTKAMGRKSNTMAKNESKLEVKILENEIEEYKQIVRTQNDLISSLNQSMTISESNKSQLESEINLIIEERCKLADEKKYFFKEKVRLEEEKVRFNESVLNFSIQRKAFESERSKYHQSKLYESFSNSISTIEPYTSDTSFESTRISSSRSKRNPY